MIRYDTSKTNPREAKSSLLRFLEAKIDLNLINILSCEKF